MVFVELVKKWIEQHGGANELDTEHLLWAIDRRGEETTSNRVSS